MSEEDSFIIKHTIGIIKTELTRCPFLDLDKMEVSLSEELCTDDDFLGFTVSIKIKPFGSDEGQITPQAIILEINYDRKDREPRIACNEGMLELDIEYSTLFMLMYFFSLDVD